MTRYVGLVIFEDATRLYLIYDGALDKAMRPLFLTESAAREWLASGMPKLNEPHDAGADEEAVTLILDCALDDSGELCFAGSFASRASKQKMWLAGPRSFMEMAYENGATASRAF